MKFRTEEVFYYSLPGLWFLEPTKGEELLATPKMYSTYAAAFDAAKEYLEGISIHDVDTSVLTGELYIKIDKMFKVTTEFSEAVS